MTLVDPILNGGFVLGILFLISILSLSMLLLKFFRLYRLNFWAKSETTAKEVIEKVTNMGTHAAIKDLSTSSKPSDVLAAKILELCKLENGEITKEEREREIELTAAKQINRLEAGSGPLATAAHLSPLLGLLGTVTGMISAFRSLETAGLRADPSVLAGGIWEALLTTALGLAIAIPLLAILRYLNAEIDKRSFSMEVLATSLLRQYAPREEKNGMKVWSDKRPVNESLKEAAWSNT